MRLEKEINFIPEYVHQKNRKRKKYALISFGVLLGILALIAAFLIPEMIYLNYESEFLNLVREKAQYSSVQNKLNEISQIKEKNVKKDNILSKINKTQLLNYELIEKVENSIPNNIRIKSYNISDKNVSFIFSTTTPDDVLSLLESLEKMNIFENVTVSSVPIIDGNNDINLSLKLK